MLYTCSHLVPSNIVCFAPNSLGSTNFACPILGALEQRIVLDSSFSGFLLCERIKR